MLFIFLFLIMENILANVRDELKLGNYSGKTISSYLRCLKEYFIFTEGDFLDFNSENVKKFLLVKQSQGLASNSVNIYLCAIKFFYHEVMKIPENIDIGMQRGGNVCRLFCRGMRFYQSLIIPRILSIGLLLRFLMVRGCG